MITSAAQQLNGREGETATLLSRCPLNFGGLGGGFAPRHLSRWIAKMQRIENRTRLQKPYKT